MPRPTDLTFVLDKLPDAATEHGNFSHLPTTLPPEHENHGAAADHVPQEVQDHLAELQHAHIPWLPDLSI